MLQFRLLLFSVIDLRYVFAFDYEWTRKVQMHQRKVHSQGGQDGILEYIFSNIHTTNKYFVEFGFDANSYEAGCGANTANLYLHHGWRGLLLDGGHSNASINLHKEWIAPDTICSTFKKHNVPIMLDYLSIDMDSIDLWVLQAILACGYKPRVISAEYNAHFQPTSYLTCDRSCPPSCSLNGCLRMYGASPRAYSFLGRLFDYTLVGHALYLDVFLVRNDLLVDTAKPKFADMKFDFKTMFHVKASYEYVAKHLIDFRTYVTTFNESIARETALKHKNHYYNLVHTNATAEKRSKYKLWKALTGDYAAITD